MWEQDHPEYVRVAQRDWRSVHRPDWVLALDQTVLSLSGDVVLVAHSLGCLAVAWWAAARADCARWVRGAMLVAPPDLSSAPGRLPALASFTPPPLTPLPFPSLLVASENDPYASLEAAVGFANGWGSEFLSVGAAGHINVDSGHGPWPDGERYFLRFQNRVCAPAPAGA
jgi:predicted alpha/beta hydrolase family esterase